MTRYYVQPKMPRPDFRLVVTFLWRDFYNVDTDGNSFNPASRDWTQLYCMNRQKVDEVFTVYPVQNEPLVLEIESEHAWLAGRVTYFLAVETQTGYSRSLTGQVQHPETLLGALGADFDLRAAESRAAKSCWRRSTLENPYPNHPE